MMVLVQHGHACQGQTDAFGGLHHGEKELGWTGIRL
jgi:hypothetical protein